MTVQWGRVQERNTTLCFHLLCQRFVVVVAVVVVFQHKICVSIIFNSFLDEQSNFRCRILTNQKQKFVVEKCQWKCMSQYFLNWNIHCAYYVDLTSFGVKKTCNTTVITLFLHITLKLRYQSTTTMWFSHKS